ncbi:uncharacterized protein LOC133831890 [Humulus lupulus]|uniref:uncharacterized protein LOC133831890 n=1 Tax=Humulus lupulus TaxID=3486 RepID=UPI002B40819D|nr:uncharacterized protein LOC133831890 [Humulus lupulus]
MKNEELAALLQAMDLKWDQRAESQMTELRAVIEERLAQVLSPNSPTHKGESSMARELTRETGRCSETSNDGREVNSILKNIRVKVARFDGANVDDWIYKINNFFDLHHVDPPIWLLVIPFHLEGVPSKWFQWMEKSGAFVDWETFINTLQLRFGASVYNDPLGRISKLTQTGRVAQFRTEFEDLMTRVTGVSEHLFMNFFIWGLKMEIRRELLLTKPVDLANAMEKAQLFEDRNEDFLGRSKGEHYRSGWPNQATSHFPSHAPNSGNTSSFGATPAKSNEPKILQSSVTPLLVKKLTPAEIREKREKGLCFSCDDKYSFGHKCKNRILILSGLDEEDDRELPAVGEQEPIEVEDSLGEEVSLNALSNSTNPRIFRLRANHGKESLEVLIDTGSNNNFIQESLANRLGLRCEDTKCFKVYMGNGNSLLCSKICHGVELILQGHQFSVDLYILPIWGLDVVLGMQWLQTLGPCIHDHKALTMEFNWQGKTVKLAGSADIANNSLMFTQFHALLRDGEIREAYRITAIIEEQIETNPPFSTWLEKLPAESIEIIQEFQDVFSEPTTLPPFRNVDHIIFLEQGSSPVNVRPYRYPYYQKDIIEKLVREMSDWGFIQHSTSPYSSPVLLVKKKDGTWRFCVDYRALNNITIKDRFPIPTIDELLDELGTATVFSKLDLRVGYHQIRMDRRDVHKTAFRTHEGHYEFLVMPFGLTNAPSTFQAAMIQLFKPIIRSCVIVFFFLMIS